MMAVEEVLAAWRDAERLLDELPPVDPDHETVRLAVATLRLTYQQLTTGSATDTQLVLVQSLETIERTRTLLASIRGKHVR